MLSEKFLPAQLRKGRRWKNIRKYKMNVEENS